MPFALPTLPYAFDALEPHISARMLESHFRQHHEARVERLNAALAGSRFADWPLERIVRYTTAAHASATLRGCATEVFNHELYWMSLSPRGGGRPFGRIANKIMAEFHSHENFIHAAARAATEQTGEGWLWITLDTGRLRITTSDASTPLRGNQTPLLAFDLCEHAFFYDYCGRKHEYVSACLERLANWESANVALSNCRLGAAVMAAQTLRPRIAPADRAAVKRGAAGSGA